MHLHHIGIVVKNLQESIERYRTLYGFTPISDIVEDTVQRVKVAFVSVGLSDESTIELIEPLSEDSPVSNFLKNRGGGLHHLCYQVEDIHKSVEDLQRKGALMTCAPVPAAAFGNLKIAFLYTPDRNLIELVEKGW